MPVVLTCSDCGRGYSLGRVLGASDKHGSRPLQCPNCYALIGRTRQG